MAEPNQGNDEHTDNQRPSNTQSDGDSGLSSQQEKQNSRNQDLEAGKSSNDAPEKEKPKDPNLVTWDDDNDQANPRNWSFKRRWICTGLVSLITFMTPIASSMIAPAEPSIDHSLNVPSTIDSELIFSIFLLAFVIGPLFLAPLSEVYGRVIVLQLANIEFLIFNLVCGFAQNTSEMLAFRFLAGLGACAPQTIGGGVLGDLWSSDERGMAVAIYTLAPVLGPAVGPLIGAWIAARTTWRWCFWSVTIFGVCVQILLFFTLRETFAPRILQIKADKLRKETGNDALHTPYEHEDRSFKAVMKRSIPRVFILLGTQPIVQFLALYMALVYGMVYLVLSIFPNIWSDVYHESTGIGGLNYISLMIGLTLGAQSGGRIVDFGFKRLKARDKTGQDPGCPEYRVPILWASTFILAAGLFMAGWSAQYHTHWIVPNIGYVIFSTGTSMTLVGLQTYTIDAYQLYAASAVGATAVARSITGFSFPLFADYMFDALGYGWGNSVLAFATLAIGYSGSLILWFYGKKLREKSKYAKDPSPK